MAGISSLGIGSGVLTSDLVDQLVAAERRPTEVRLDQKTERTEALISAYGMLRSAVTELRLPMRQLGSAEAMKSFSATSSTGNVDVSIDASKASKGSYSVEVVGLAESQALASTETFADRDATSVGTGTITLQVGDKTTEITIDSSNDTLQGLANAINESGAGVSAGVIDTGDGYRLTLSAEETGTANAVKISATEDAGAEGLARFAFDPADPAGNPSMEQTIAAADAVMKINGVEVTRSTNTIENVVDGLTFNLTETGKSTVKVEQDTAAVAERVQAFVDKFNELQKTIADLSSYDSETGQGSILTGDSTVRNIQSQLRQVLTDVIPGLENANVRSLTDVGLGTDWRTGELQFDSQKFQQQLRENPDDVTALFAEQGRTSDSQVEFVRSGSATEPGDYSLNITQMATRGSLNYAAADTSTVNVMAGNMFTFEVDGETQVSVFLENGPDGTPLSGAGDDFTGEEFAAAMQQALNSSTELKAAGRSVQVAWDATNGLTFTSGNYGSNSNVRLTSALNAPGLNSKDGTAGLDVAGTINGVRAEGDGQVLFLPNSVNSDAAGLQVRITGGDVGNRGSVSFIEGVSERAVDTITRILGAEGSLSSRTDSLNRDLERIQEDRIKLEQRIQSYQERLVSQFSAADSLISQLNSTRDYVSQQLAALAPRSGNE
ncbi:flagellar filament capping protein FliD [Marinobacter nauticus]|jgi:Flagellar capping protein|uniref:Flagellar hook-associated protein 2 n=1 Tax=Marinobacter nauticus TaxID=2743 RepID=A0A368UPP1_MARNT|nr:flagellar filament capping protein FliD [Marinobacter nauticus]RBP69293.1 flagellar hook-associated protein 2 [Marinobacter nauticus]RCW30772.1 flagellar hook-associated protein 2 [Marinobacter nauticus]